MAGGASTAYSLASAGQSGGAGVAYGLGGVARAGGSAAMSPLRRSASSVAGGVKDSFNAGGKVAFEATGGSPTMGSIGGATAADATSPSPDPPPAWARRMKRSQPLRHGESGRAHVRTPASNGHLACRPLL